MVAEEHLRLEHDRCRQLFDKRIGAVIRARLYADMARQQDVQMVTGRALANELRAWPFLLEVKLRVSDNLAKVIAAQTQEEGKLL